MNKPPNIVLITVDSLRADRLGCYNAGVQHTLTPNLDALSSQSMIFEQAFAQGPFTAFSVPSLFTGKYPCRLKKWITRTTSWEQPTGVLVDGTTTFPEILRDAGYHTAAFHSNPLLSRLFGFHKGFDVFYDDVLLGGSGLARNVKLGLARAQRVFRTDPYVGAQRLNALVMDWLITAQQPFFLWIHYMDVHGPYLARKVLKYLSPGERVWRKSVAHPERITAAEREILLRNYHRQIELLDAELGRFLPSLESHAPAEDRLTIITADHGDEFGEHGGHSHGHKLYDELLHVPLIISLPGALPGRASQITELVQVAPTILEFAGCGTSAAGAFDGASLLPRLLGSTQHAGKGYALSEGEMPPHNLISVRTADWKLIRRNDDDRELYHLPTDPGERTNLINTSTAASPGAELEARIRMHCATETPEKGGRDAAFVPPIEISDAEAQLVTQRLRDLGYLG